MSYAPEQSYPGYAPHAVALAEEWERTTFIRRTYTHLLGAIGLFALIETIVFSLVSDAQMIDVLTRLGSSRWNWLIVLGAFMAVSWIAERWARSSTSLSVQYFGLGLYVVAEAVIFIPLLFIGSKYEHAIPTAGLMTGIIFTGLTAVVFFTRADFSWMGRYLMLAGFAAIGFIVCGAIFGWSLGLWFSGAMVVFAGGYILYDTSNILHHYRTDQYVAASLGLFASVALLFWYVLRIVISLSSRD
ncbi:MAG: permease [Planctomycetaceae bacterium]|nr:permease [Planctomycetaceae bacterium]